MPRAADSHSSHPPPCQRQGLRLGCRHLCEVRKEIDDGPRRYLLTFGPLLTLFSPSSRARERRFVDAVRLIEDQIVKSKNASAGDQSGSGECLPLPPLPLFALPPDSLCGAMLHDADFAPPGRTVEVFCDGLVGVFILRDDEMLVRAQNTGQGELCFCYGPQPRPPLCRIPQSAARS